MNRPIHVWLAFGLCFAVLLSALGWVSRTAVRLEAAQREASQRAELEERVRLALWRVDSLLAPLVIEESARPYHVYDPFPPANRAYTKAGTSYSQGDVLLPSPLLSLISSNLLLHFQFTPGGPITSPQVPTGKERSLAEGAYTTRDAIELAQARLDRFRKLLAEQPGALSPLPAAEGPVLDNRGLLVQCATWATNAEVALANLSLAQTLEDANVQVQVPMQDRMDPTAQESRNQLELNARANIYQNAKQQVFMKNTLPERQAAPVAVREGLFTPVWLGSELVLVRRVELGPQFLIQGCWLDWSSIKQWLLGSIQDLFPDAHLESIRTPPDASARVLVALPVQLVTGALPVPQAARWSPVQFSLVIAWLCVLLAGAAVAFLLNGTVALSERRAAFVSAVTHELRTPLTTFRMYSEMLADGMVSDDQKRRQYLQTLCSEASRLSHLVENVLAYARLERGRARGRIEEVSLQELIARVRERLEQRATQSEMELVVDAAAESLATVVHVDVPAVEQILFNLVDNACKYAAPTANPRIIHLEALAEGEFAMLRVRDHGQGISAEGAKRLFQPFSKSAHEAAHSAPGVGLGLALCRRLSRSMGGNLRWDNLVKNGACFVLALPLRPPKT